MKTIICTTPIDHLKGLKNKLKSKGQLIYKPKIKALELKKILKKNNIQYLDEPYTRFKGKKEQQETFFIKDPHGNILELKTLNNS